MNGALQAPPSASISINPTQIEVTGSVFTREDNVGIVRFADIAVNDGGAPLENIEVEVVGPNYGIFLIPTEAVKLVDFPTAPEDWETLRDEICVDEFGNFDNTVEWCAWYYDIESNLYYEFGSNYADAGGYKPNYYKGVTDVDGVLRIYVFIDSLVGEGNEDTAGGETTGASSLSNAIIWVTTRFESAELTISASG
jgi:hypothetical protein